MSAVTMPSAAGLGTKFGARNDIEAPSLIEAAALRSDKFRLEREDEWRRLERILSAIEKGRIRRLSDDDILELPALYRMAASSLAVARETSLDSSTIAYLETLVQRAWFQVYGPREGFFSWFRRFLSGGLSRAVRSIWLDICIALAVMVAGTAVGWLLVARDQEWYYSLVPAQFTDARQPGASREVLLDTLKVQEDASGMSAFAAQLFTNNSSVCILAFALGFAFGIPSLLLLVQNLAILGAMMWLYDTQGLLPQFGAWLAVHGTTELFAIMLSSAAGIHIGRKMAFPGKRSILSAASDAGKRGAQVMVGVVLMLVFAALLEAFPRQLATTETRGLIGAFMLIFWLTYFFAFRRNRGEEPSA